MVAFRHWSEELVDWSSKGRTKGLLKLLSPQQSFSTFLSMSSIVMWKLQVMKQLCECRMQVLGSPLNTLMCFLSKKSMPCLHKQFVNPHLLMVLISSLGIFVFVIFSSAVILNFKCGVWKKFFGLATYQFGTKVLSRGFKKLVHQCDQMLYKPTLACYLIVPS